MIELIELNYKTLHKKNKSKLSIYTYSNIN